MAEFPKLKSGAVAQYPSSRELRVESQALRFLDNGEQRYQESVAGRRRWTIELAWLTASEAAEVRNFFVAMRGSAGRFDFEDPWTGTVVNNCRFGEDELVLSALSERDTRAVVTIWGP
jgi:hypothetical protein